MRLHNEPILLIDESRDNVQRAVLNKFKALQVNYDKNRKEFSEILESTVVLICTLGDPDLNFWICNLAKNDFNIQRVISYVEKTADLDRYEKIGIETMNAAIDRAVFLSLIARNPAMYSLLTRTDDDKELAEVPILNPQFHNKKLRNVVLPGDILILALRRNGELIVPHGDTEFFLGDYLTIAGSLEFFDETKKLLEQGN
jgi:CPA2 family monovalent cation:H+ antiporter-2